MNPKYRHQVIHFEQPQTEKKKSVRCISTQEVFKLTSAVSMGFGQLYSSPKCISKKDLALVEHQSAPISVPGMFPALAKLTKGRK